MSDYTDLDLAILKSLLANKKNAIDFSNSCDAKVFSTGVWQLATLILGYVKVYKEAPTLRVIEDQLAKGNNKTLIEYTKNLWAKIEDFKYNEKEFPFDLQKIKDRYSERQLSQLRDSIVNTPIDKLNVDKSMQEIQKVSQNIKSVKEKKSYEVRSVKEYLPLFRDKFLAKRNNPELQSGIKIGFSFFDEATNGVKGADFILVAAESGFGKSTWLLNAAVGTWLQTNPIGISDKYSTGYNIAYFSLEMPWENCFNRFISRLSGVDYKKIETTKVNKEEAAKLKAALDFINHYPYDFHIIDMPNANANQIDVVLNELSITSEIGVVFVDYLGIMATNDKISEEQDWLKQGIISYELRAIARERNIPVFSAVQLNRKGGKDPDDAIGLHRLARSASIATHATCVIQIESRKNEENYPELNYWIIKLRNGPKGKGTLIKNLAAATLIDNKSSKEEDEFGFTNYNEDIEEKLEAIEI